MARIETQTLVHNHEQILVKRGGFTIEHALIEEDHFTYALTKNGQSYTLLLFRIGNSVAPTINDIDTGFVKRMLDRQRKEKRTLLLRWTISINDAKQQPTEIIDTMTWHPLSFQQRVFLEAYRCKESFELFLAAAAAYNSHEKDLWEPLLAHDCEYQGRSSSIRTKDAVKAHIHAQRDTVQTVNFGYRLIGVHRCQPLLYSPEKRFALLLATKEDGSAVHIVRPVERMDNRTVVWEPSIRTTHPLIPPVSLYIAKSRPLYQQDSGELALDFTLAFLDEDMRKRFQERRLRLGKQGNVSGLWNADTVHNAWVDDSGYLRFPNGETLSPFWIHANCPIVEHETGKTKLRHY